MKLNVTNEVDQIRVSAADMIWDMFSATLLSEGDTPIPISKYHVAQDEQLVVISLSNPIPPGFYRLLLDFGSVMRTDLMGCYISYEKDPSGVEHPFVMTQFEPNYARTCFPTFDEPDIKMPFTITLAIPSDVDAVSNAAIVLLIS